MAKITRSEVMESSAFKMLPVGLKVSNKILREMYWAESAEALDKLVKEYILKYK